jgi:phosphoglycolate phosphatase
LKKPDPRHLLAALDALGARSDAAAMIGDNENDAAAAHAAGLPLLLMRYGYARVDPESLAADAMLDHFSEIPRALERLGFAAPP